MVMMMQAQNRRLCWWNEQTQRLQDPDCQYKAVSHMVAMNVSGLNERPLSTMRCFWRVGLACRNLFCCATSTLYLSLVLTQFKY